MNKELICITCPIGCHLCVVIDEAGEIINVSGNGCPRGAIYAKKELTSPVRVLTSTVKIEGAAHPLLPIYSKEPLPKEKIAEAMNIINQTVIQAPIKMGDVVIADIAATGIDILASCDMKKQCSS